MATEILETRIINPVTLDFDPRDPSTTSELKEVFNDDLSRTLWLAIRQSSSDNQFFERDCLGAARYLRQRGIPDSPESLHLILGLNFRSLNSYGLEFARELLPYIKGEKTLHYSVNKDP